MDYSSKNKSSNVHYFGPPISTVGLVSRESSRMRCMPIDESRGVGAESQQHSKLARGLELGESALPLLAGSQHFSCLPARALLVRRTRAHPGEHAHQQSLWWLECLGGARDPCSRQKIAKNVTIFERPPRQNGHAAVTSPNGAQSFERNRGVPHGSHSVEAFLNRRCSSLLSAERHGLRPKNTEIYHF